MNFIDQIAASYRPALDAAAQSARQYGDAICHGLAAIQQAIRDMERTHPYVQVHRILPATPGVATVAEVPPGQIWEMEIASSSEVTAGFSLIFRSDSQFRMRLGSGSTFMAGPMPLRFVGPCTITCASSLASTQELFCQFRVLKPQPRRTHSAGQIMAGIAPTAAERIHAPEHTGLGVG